MNKFLKFILIGCVSSSTCLADEVANRGLTHPQPVITLPKSRAEITRHVAQPLPKLRDVKIEKVGYNAYILSDGWKLFSEKDKSKIYNGKVPGTVLTSLLEAGEFPDPYYGLNNLYIPDSLCRQDWWYTLEFDSPRAVGKSEVWFDFEGVNYIAEIYLNDVFVGDMKGAFTRGDFNVSGLLRDKKNVLAVKIRPPHNPGIPHEQSKAAGNGGNGGFLCLDGPTFISSEGWDWVPGIRDRNIGIWQDVFLKFDGGIRIKDPQVITRLELPDTTKANLTVKTLVENAYDFNKEVTVSIDFEGKRINKNVVLKPGESGMVEFLPADYPDLVMNNPRLWWPNGYGDQNLYDMKLSVSEDGKISDIDSVRFGIRELSYELAVGYPGDKIKRVNYRPALHMKGKPVFNTVDRLYVEGGMCMPKLADGIDADLLPQVEDPDMEHYLVINVNGKRILCRGGNWGMDDGMKRVERERLEPYFRLHKEANFNMVRNWTGESTEKVFYDLCDEYGMLVFNDFWLSTQGYNHEVNDDDLYLRNAEDVVVRFRNHPSIAIWNPRNEGFAPEYIDRALSKMIAEKDGTRHYSPNSTHCNLRPSGPWDYKKDKGWYFTDRVFGFNTEQGTTSIPTEETIFAMMPLEDSWPIGDVWYYHDLHGGQQAFCEDLKDKLGEASSLKDFCRKAQILNYDSHRAMLEATNSRMWNSTSGILLWMSHPAWPSMVWQAYSSDYETMGSFYGCRKACEPLHIQLNPNNRTVSVVNTTLHPYHGLVAKYILYSINGNQLASKSVKLDINDNSCKKVFEQPMPEKRGEAMVERLMLCDRKGNIISVNDYILPDENGSLSALNTLSAPVIKTDIKKKGDKSIIRIANKGKVPAVSLKLNARDAKSGERILPAYASDGYFNLMPGESREVVMEYEHPDDSYISVEGYNLERIKL